MSADNIAPEDTDDLAKGDETYIQPAKIKDDTGAEKEINIEASWDKIFSYVGSAMIGECSESIFRDKIQLAYYHSLPEGFGKNVKYDDIVIYHVVFDQIKIQLQALGLITRGTKKRTVSDNEVYWKLTPYGESYLLKVSAIKSKTVPF